MKTIILAAGLALALAGSALAQTPAPAAPAAATAAGTLSVQTTPVGEIIKNATAKAALEGVLPEISQYYDQIATMTLAEIVPMSNGAIDAAKLAAIQAEFDKIG
jgi:hypothetical protein